MTPFRRLRRVATSFSFSRLAPSFVLAGALGATSCSSGDPAAEDVAQGTAPILTDLAFDPVQRLAVNTAFATRAWPVALTLCSGMELTAPNSCDARWCDFLARSMLVSDGFSQFVIPRIRQGGAITLADQAQVAYLDLLINNAVAAGDEVTKRSCSFDLPLLPITFGEAADPLLDVEARGRFTPRSAHLLAALLDGTKYAFEEAVALYQAPVPPRTRTDAPLPDILGKMRDHLTAHDTLLLSDPADPANGKGGWLDRNHNGRADAADTLLVDFFKPGTTTRVFDWSDGEFVNGESLPVEPITPTAKLPSASCGYKKFHIDDVASGADVSLTDGLTFSPDNQKVAFPLIVNNKLEVNTAKLDGSSRTCITCGQPGTNDGVRWRPTNDALLFVSTRDHAYAIGGDAAGFGQELYAMKLDGSQPTRLTTSHGYATNYHANWSNDGKRIVWGSTDTYAWDVMVADFVSDARGMRLTNVKRLVHDNTWWETHGFTPDGKSVITTNTRAGFLSTDIYLVDIATGAKHRVTGDLAWDEHARLSYDGRKLAWISGRWHPAAMRQLSTPAISPVNDFLWIMPGIFLSVTTPPTGYTTELTMMDADGNGLQQLTSDDQVVADNAWSFDSKRIFFRQSNPRDNTTRLRMLTFDDCK